MPRRKSSEIDWDAIERQYRLGQKSNGVLASEFGVDVASIGRKAKAKGWIQDHKTEVDQLTKHLLLKAQTEESAGKQGIATPNATAASDPAANATPVAEPAPTRSRRGRPDEIDILVAAQTNVEVIMRHRKRLARFNRLTDTELDFLEGVQENLPELEEMGEDLRAPNDNGVDKRHDLYAKIIDGPGRVDTLKKLAETDKITRAGEREAFGLDQQESAASPLEEMLKKLDADRRAQGL